MCYDSDPCPKHEYNLPHEYDALIFQVTSDLQKVAKDSENLEPSLLALGEKNSVKEIYLVAEKSVICKVKHIQEAPLVLLSAFYSYNMFYPKGTENFYAFLEYIILDKKPTKMTANLSHFITTLSIS